MTNLSKCFSNEGNFWRMRSRGYARLQWARNKGYLGFFMRKGKFRPTDHVLDVGTGTGIIAHAVAPYVNTVTAIDISRPMLKQARAHAHPNEKFRPGDVRDLPFRDGKFDKITARMVFHHVTHQNHRAIRECHRVLKEGGTMILSEGIPPTRRVKDFYVKIFKLKEKRITFYKEDLVLLMKAGNFCDIRVHTFWSRKMSVMNWLKCSGLPEKTQKKIFQLHLDLFPAGKRDYNMRITKNRADCFIDMKFLVLTGRKQRA